MPELSYRESEVIYALAWLYKREPLAVAWVCDEKLDPSGRLLGEVRKQALLTPTKEGK